MLYRGFLFEADSGGGGSSDQHGSDAETQANANATAGDEESKPSVDWEKRYKGQQKYAQKLQSQLNALREEHEKAIAEYEQRIGELESRYKELESEKAELSETAAEKAARLSEAEKKLTVLQKINDPENPDLQVLAPLYNKGLLAVGDLEGEELDNYLKEYAETIASQLKGSLEASVAGSKPSGKSTNVESAGMTEDEIYQKLMTVDPGTPEFEELQRLYDEMSEE